MANKLKKPSPTERWGQLLNGRLTDKQVFDLFDEFGMAKRLQTKEDYEWVRHNLPNVPEEMKKILKIELEKENALRKETEQARAAVVRSKLAATKSNVQTTENVGTTQNEGTVQSPQMPQEPVDVKPKEDGKGGPTNNFQTSPDFSLVKFTADPNGADPGDASTIWWADHITRTLRPIMSMQAFRDMYPDDQYYQAAMNSIESVNPSELQPGGLLANFLDLGEDYGIYERQQMKSLDFNPMDLQNAYGQAKSEESTLVGIRAFDSFMSFLQNPDSGIDNTFLNKVKNDKNLTAFYINALAYGGYSPDDVYKDIKRQELASKGDTSMAGIKVISPNINKNQYVVTNAGRLATSLPSITPPAQIGNISREVWISPAAMLSDKYYELTNPEDYDPTSQAFKDRLDQIKSEFYDYVVQALTTGTERDKAVADEKWKQYKDELERTTGYKLSDNALEAWRQLQKIDVAASEAGLNESGIENQQVDEALRDYRERNRRIREDKMSQIRSEEATQAQTYYSPDQIQAMNDEDSAAGLPRAQWRSVLWGLTPTEPMTLASFIADFRSKYPDKSNVTDAEIKERYFDNLYDQNGNYRSKLYQNYQDNLNKVKLGYTLNAIPGESLDEYKNRIAQQELLDQEEAQQKDVRTAGSGKLFDQYGNVIDYSRPTQGYGYESLLGVTGPDAGTLSQEGTINTTGREVTEYDPATGNTKVVGLGEAFTPGWKFASGSTAGRKQILNTASLAKYKPSDYVKEMGTFYLKDNVKPIEGTYKISTGPTAAPTPAKNTTYKLPAGMSSTTSTLTPPANPPASTTSFTPKAGTSYIPNEAAMKNYTGIYKGEGSKLYGTLKTPGTQSAPSSGFTPRAGTSYIPNVESMGKYKDIYKDPNSKKLYGTLK